MGFQDCSGQYRDPELGRRTNSLTHRFSLRRNSHSLTSPLLFRQRPIVFKYTNKFWSDENCQWTENEHDGKQRPSGDCRKNIIDSTVDESIPVQVGEPCTIYRIRPDFSV